MKACTRAASTVAGKHVTTAEGLAEREQAAIVSAFEQEGAVQCGFCMPGFAMTTTALLDANPDPTRDEVVRALRSNVCRCTGYRMVEDAVLRTGRILRGEEEVAAAPDRIRMSDRAPRPDAAPKVLGTGLYTDDIRLEGMVHATALRSAYPRAVVEALDVSRARAHPDCLAVLTAADVPENVIGHLVDDWDVLVAEGATTRYVGDALALVVCAHERNLAEVVGLIDVRYTELEPVTSPQQALAPGAPLLHPDGNVLTREEVDRGDARGRPGRVGLRRVQHLPHPVAGARLHGAGVRGGPAVGRRRGRGVHLRPVGLRRAARDRADARPAAREGARALDARRRRVRRQGGHERAAPRGAGGLAHRAAGEGQVLP